MTNKENHEKEEMAKILTNIDALQFGIFKLTSGKVSPYYIDLRIVPSFPDAYKDIIDHYTQTIKNKILLSRKKGRKNIFLMIRSDSFLIIK